MLVAREKEKTILKKYFESSNSEFIAIYGRRRIGKTFLVREYFQNSLVFDHSGINSKRKSEQLKAFKNTLADYKFKVDEDFDSWLSAFQALKQFIDTSKIKRKVIFIDELSWLDTKNSGFLTALESFWNGWCAKRKDIVLIVCGSSASYILNKVIHNVGGLYNRLSVEINLKPFTLKEVEELLLSKNIKLDKKSICDLYMCLGGIPYYYSFVEKDMSVPQIINNLFFEENAKLKDEFDYLFKSLFIDYENYSRIIEILSTKKLGYTRKEILKD